MAICLNLGDDKSIDKAIELMKSGIKGSEVSIDINNGVISQHDFGGEE